MIAAAVKPRYPGDLIIRPRERKETVSFLRKFEWLNTPGAGFEFECSEQGVIDTAQLQPAGLANLTMCLADKGATLRDYGIRRHVHQFIEPALLRCHCGRNVELWDALDNDCECGRCYNLSGQAVIRSTDCDDQGNPYGDDFEDF